MRKVFEGLLASIAIAAVTVLGFATPAMAEGATPPVVEPAPAPVIDSWETTVTPRDDGSVLVSSVITPLLGTDHIDIAFPTTAEFGAMEGWGGKKSLDYGYTNFAVSEGYTVDVKLNRKAWSIVTINYDEDAVLTEPLTFSYVTHNALFNTKTNQQMNLPLVDSSHGNTITNYKVTVASDFGLEAVCVRNSGHSADECLESTNEDISTATMTRNSTDRISLRAKYPADTFEISNTAEKPETVELPSKYLKEFVSFDAEASVDEKTGLVSVVNTIEFDKNEKNSGVIALAFPATKLIGETNHAQVYSKVQLEGASADQYELTVEADDYKKHPNGHTLVTIKPKTVDNADALPVAPTPEIPVEKNAVDLQTVEFSYSVNGSVTKDVEPQIAHILVKPALPKIAVANISLEYDKTSPLPTGGFSTCYVEGAKSFECDFDEKEYRYSATGVINKDFVVGYEYAEPVVTVATPLVVPTVDENGEEVGGGWSFNFSFDIPWAALGMIIIILGAIFAAIRFFAVNRRRSLAGFMAGALSKSMYKVAADKAAYFIPAKEEVTIGGSSKKRGFGKSKKNAGSSFTTELATSSGAGAFSDVSYTVPRLDDGKEIQPYLYPFLSQKNEDTAMLTSALSIIASLASKDALRIVHDNAGRAGIDINAGTNETSLSAIEKVALQEIKNNTRQGGKPMISPRLLEKMTDNTRLGSMIQDEVNALEFFEKSGGLFAKGNAGRTTATGASALAGLASLGLIVGGVVTGGLLPVIAGGVGLAASGASLGASGVALGKEQKIRTVAGTGYLARMESFRNYLKIARPESRYSVERSDVDGKYLPWSVVFDMPEKWVEVFGAPTSTKAKNVLIAGNAYPANTLASSLKQVLEAIAKKRDDFNDEPLIDPNRF